uniref:Uncharacterized protein n=1 Tax=Anguilla anguilla TaxID=7936 RepID=A0A0E9QDL4_ANGAN
MEEPPVQKTQTEVRHVHGGTAVQ